MGRKPTSLGEIVQLDTLTVSPHPGRPAIKQFTAHDPVAKWTCAQAWRHATAHNAKRFLDKLQADMPFPSEAIQVDGGSEFKADFETECQRRGIDLFELPPRSPKRNGHVERNNGTWRYEFYATWDLPNDDLDYINRWIDAFADEFNTFRPHQALGGHTPAQYLAKQPAEETLPSQYVLNQDKALSREPFGTMMCLANPPTDVPRRTRRNARMVVVRRHHRTGSSTSEDSAHRNHGNNTDEAAAHQRGPTRPEAAPRTTPPAYVARRPSFSGASHRIHTGTLPSGDAPCALPDGENRRMAKRMLVDASHAEETRVVVANGTRLEEFDFESAARKQLKGNVYLAKVMRAEPSLQAAFVDYGGNRHGFLPFGEIHPDYYQIPVADREALYEEQETAERPGGGAQPVEQAPKGEAEIQAEPGAEDLPRAPDGDPHPQGAETANDGGGESEESGDGGDEPATDGDVEVLGGDEMDDLERRRLQASRSLLSRRYHIQEVIKKRQIMLVQVVKEERGNKGAALTTYLSLAGRYIVLMPNAIRGGGISRKIVDADDRRRLKKITNDLDIPARMSVIVRTAGLSRSKAEIKRDLDYLLRRWQDIRELTLQSTAPCIINEEANLIRRSIRDLYTRDIEQILIEGEEGYRTAKGFMKTLIPSHTAKVQPYRDRIPLFTRYQIESQLDSMYRPEIQLKSGGYLVINPTEALVSIDVNSGRSTKERNIEETALKTNLEASEEIARQLRLRDLAGLIVIDFIDMDESRNQRAVERKLKETMRNDRARIRIGRISAFGLMELSRQRLRPSLLEASMERCTSCRGTGVRRSVESSAVHVLRAIEEEGLQERSSEIVVRIPAAVALYVMNWKRRMLGEIEQRYEFAVHFQQDDDLVPPNYSIESMRARPSTPDEPSEESGEEESDGAKANQDAEAKEGEPIKRRRRRKPRGDAAEEAAPEADAARDATEPEEAETRADTDAKKDDGQRAKRRRRGRRGGRRRTTKQREELRETGEEAPEEPAAAADVETPAAPAPTDEPPVTATAPADDGEPAATAGGRMVELIARASSLAPLSSSADAAGPSGESAAGASNESDGDGTEPDRELEEIERPPRRGWWQRLGTPR